MLVTRAMRRDRYDVLRCCEHNHRPGICQHVRHLQLAASLLHRLFEHHSAFLGTHEHLLITRKALMSLWKSMVDEGSTRRCEARCSGIERAADIRARC